MKKRWLTSLLLVAVLSIAAIVGATTRASAAPKLTQHHAAAEVGAAGPVRRLLRGSLKGYYKAAGLNVTLKNGGPNIIPEQVVASAGRRSSASTGCRACSRPVTRAPTSSNVAQVFARSGMTQLTWKSSGINTIAKMKGKKVGELARRQPVRAVRRADQERHGPAQQQGRDDRPAAVRHGPLPEPPGRLGVGDDLQRARAGPRVEEPEDRQALPARPT